MTALYVLIPISVFMAAGFVLICLSAIQGGQFDDLESPQWRMLFDDQSRVITKQERIPS